MLRLKIILTVIVSALVLASALYLVSINILSESYAKIERSVMEKDIMRVQGAIDNYRNSLQVKLRDWAQWDDSYQFVQDENETFVEGNLGDTTLVNLEINLLAYINVEDEIVYSNYVDLKNGESLPSEEIVRAIIENTTGSIPDTQGVVLDGILRLSEGLIVVEWLPILTSVGAGPVPGSIFFGKFLNATMIEQLSDLTQLHIEIFDYDAISIPDDVSLAKEALGVSEEPFIQPLTEDLLAGYFMIKDIYENPVAIIRVSNQRDVSIQGARTISLFVSIAGFVILFFGITIIVLVERLLLSRFSRLTKAVSQISISDLSKATIIVEDPDDEVSALARKINTLLKELSKAQDKEISARQLEHATNERLKKSIEDIEKMNKYMVGRELRMIELKKKVSELEHKL